jgi:hypothetical protein
MIQTLQMRKPLRVPSQDQIEIGRRAYRSQEGDDEQQTLNLFHATASKVIPPHYCVELPGTNNICANNGA